MDIMDERNEFKRKKMYNNNNSKRQEKIRAAPVDWWYKMNKK